MRMLKVAALALTGLFAVTTVQAATFVSPAAKPTTETVIDLVTAKKKTSKPAKKTKAKAKKKSKAKASYRTCGTYKYFSKKDKKCVDARAKK